MSRERALKATSAPAEQPHRHGYRAYTIAQLCRELSFTRRTFFNLRRAGRLPFLEELRPRLGRVVRYRADLVDRYLDGQWGEPRAFRVHVRQSRARATHSATPEIGVDNPSAFPIGVRS